MVKSVRLDSGLWFRPATALVSLLLAMGLSDAMAQSAPAPAGAPEAEAVQTTSSDNPDAASGKAVGVNYELDVDAPAEIKELIERQTLIGRWRRRPEYQTEQFEALFSRLREELETILRSQGYFDYEINIEGDVKRVKIGIIAGARTTVNKVELRLLGPIKEFPEIERILRERWNLPEGTFYNSGNWESISSCMLSQCLCNLKNI